MNYAQIRSSDLANGPGIRVSLFVSGCPHRCPGCFNEPYQDFAFGKKWDDRVQESFITLGKLPYVDGFSILGGEPMAQGWEMVSILEKIKEETGKGIWLWSGFAYESLSGVQRAMLPFIDVLVDGPFIQELYKPGLLFRGSRNQRIIDVQTTLKGEGIRELKEEAFL